MWTHPEIGFLFQADAVAVAVNVSVPVSHERSERGKRLVEPRQRPIAKIYERVYASFAFPVFYR